jgi:NAD(P)H-hydrate epimerase
MKKELYISSREMARVDRLAMGKYGVAILQMMENAGRGVARFVFGLKPRKVVVLYGKENNGADGLATARHLRIYGVPVEIVPASSEKSEMVKHQLKSLKLQGIVPQKSFSVGRGDVIIDSLLGYNIKGNPRGRYAELIERANSSKARIVSFDLPSGMNPDSGLKNGLMIDADYTLTLALPKIGLKGLKNLYLVNLGIPNELYKELGLNIRKLFEKGDVVRIK